MFTNRVFTNTFGNSVSGSSSGGALYGTPTKDLYFLAGTMPSGITFTRASSAMANNASGVLTSFTTDAARLDYDGATLAAKGLLIEGAARTNYARKNRSFDDAYWTKENGATVSANATTSPDGTANADKLISAPAGSGSVQHNLRHDFTVTSGTYTISYYTKAAGYSKVSITIGGQTTAARASFDLVAKTAAVDVAGGPTSTFSSAGIEEIASGFFRVWAVFSGTGGFVRFQLIDAGNNASFVGDGASGVYVYGAQLEAGAFQTSFIPNDTDSADATRAQDIASLALAGNTWHNVNEGTWVVDAVMDANNAAVASPRLIGTNTTLDHGPLSIEAATGKLQSWDGATAITAANAITLGTAFKAACAYGPGGRSICLNGGTVATGTYSSTVAATATEIRLGRGNNATVTPTSILRIRRAYFIPYKLSNANIQALTA